MWGTCTAASGESFGYQLTFFRVALRQPDPQARSAWSLNTIYFAHLALTDAARRTFPFGKRPAGGAGSVRGGGGDHEGLDRRLAGRRLQGEEFHLVRPETTAWGWTWSSSP